MNSKMRFGILGCGGIADFHARALCDSPLTTLVGAADATMASAQRFALKYDIRAYADYNEMLRDHEIDAVCICTPSGFHAENAIAALKAKKHVVLEKPMALTVEDAERIKDVCAVSGCLLTVISQIRFSPDVIKLKELVSNHAFGKLLFCNLALNYWRDTSYYSTSPWKGTFKHDGGGALMNQGIHGIDLMLHILGPARVRCSEIKTTYHAIEVEDTAAAMLTFENGAVGTVTGSTCAFPGHPRKLEIIGTDGCAVLMESNLEKLVIHDQTLIDSSSNTQVTTYSDPLAMSHQFHQMQIENLVKAAWGQEPLLIDAEQGQKAIRLIREIYDKASTAASQT